MVSRRRVSVRGQKVKVERGLIKMKMNIGIFLFTRLKRVGIEHVFGVPGCFNLQLLGPVKEVEGIELIGTCNELYAIYAADGYARMRGGSAHSSQCVA